MSKPDNRFDVAIIGSGPAGMQATLVLARTRKKIVVYISPDNGRTFGHRHELDHFTGDGGYTSAVRLSSRRALMVYYSDSASAESKPDIKQVLLTLSLR